jgi:two-component system, chemotaxis family, chemotaxis protein CheY
MDFMFQFDAKFLVIDDYSSMRIMVKQILTDLGYTKVEEAENGKIALEKIKLAIETGTPFDCIISDWNMPVISGIELLRAIRSVNELKNLPFILVTAEGEQPNVVEAAKLGVSAYVMKPFSPSIVAENLRRAYSKFKGE